MCVTIMSGSCLIPSPAGLPGCSSQLCCPGESVAAAGTCYPTLPCPGWAGLPLLVRALPGLIPLVDVPGVLPSGPACSVQLPLMCSNERTGYSQAARFRGMVATQLPFNLTVRKHFCKIKEWRWYSVFSALFLLPFKKAVEKPTLTVLKC